MNSPVTAIVLVIGINIQINVGMFRPHLWGFVWGYWGMYGNE
jgi:hypothetical protein